MGFTKPYILFLVLSIAAKGRVTGYQPGSIYHYVYNTTAWLKTPSSMGSVGVNISLDFSIAPVFVKDNVTLFSLVVANTQIDQVARVTSLPVYFTVSHNTIESVYTSVKDTTFDINLKKGAIGLLQVDPTGTTKTEVGVLGECDIRYLGTASSLTKETHNCRKSDIGDEYLQNDKVTGISVNRVYSTEYVISDDVIHTATSSYNVTAQVNTRASLGAVTHCRQELKLVEKSDAKEKINGQSVDEAIETLSKSSGHTYTISLLPATYEPQQCTKDTCKPVAEVLATSSSSLTSEKLATVESAKAFLQLVESLRNVNEDAFTDLMNSNEDILHQIMDAMVATRSLVGYKLLIKRIDFTDDDNTDIAERFLLSVSHITHCESEHVEDILELVDQQVPNIKVRESILLTAGALVHTLCRDIDLCQFPVVERYRRTINEGLTSCSGDDDCTLMYLRSLSNAGLPTAAAYALRYLDTTSSRPVAIAAIDCFRRLTNQRAHPRLCAVVGDDLYDTSVRAEALNAVLAGKYDVFCIRHILKRASNWNSAELKAYAISAILEKIRIEEGFKQALSVVMSQAELNSYVNLAVRGTSIAVSGYIAQSNDVNSTYSLLMENSPSQIMKRSTMAVNLVRERQARPFLKFGLYAYGMDSMVGEEATEDGADAEEATAGMSLELNGVSVRPIVFFTGSSGLMSAAWNAPSDLTSALQGNIMMHDHNENLVLPNGLVARLRLESAVSIDLAGSVSISLWSRNSQSLVRNSGALWLEGQLSLSTPVTGIIGVGFSGEAAAYIDFNTDVDFYEMPIKMCLRMNRPAFTYIEKHENFEIKERQKVNKKTRQTVNLNGESFPLHKTNDQQCAQFD